MVVLDIDTKAVIERIDTLPGHVYWTTPENWAQYKKDMKVFSKVMKQHENELWYGIHGRGLRTKCVA